MDIFGLSSRHGLDAFEQIAIIGVLVVAFISLAYAWWLRGSVLSKDTGTSKMREVWDAIRIGADSYLSRQLRTIIPATKSTQPSRSENVAVNLDLNPE